MTAGFSAIPLTEQGGTAQKFHGVARILGPKWSHLPTLSIGMLGVQIFWSVEMGYASPYLLSLGLSKSSMAMVFLAGPLSGLIMQPVIGVVSDNSTSRFGRRRPYMLLGTFTCVLAMLLLGYTRGIAAIFTGWNNPENDSLTIGLAVLSIYLIDFAINAVQALDRALLVDTLPPSAQAAGNAWAARMLGFGAVVGFFVGTIPLPSILPFLGTTQLQVLSVIVSLLLLSGHILMAACVKERVLLKTDEERDPIKNTKKPNAFVREVRDLWTNILTLPRVIRQICIIQFFTWIAWFPILFYTTIYIGDLYKRATPMAASPSPPAPTPGNPPLHMNVLIHRARDAEATRLGSRALFFSALLALLINLLAPVFVATAASRSGRRKAERTTTSGALGGLGDGIGSARVGGDLGSNTSRTRTRRNGESEEDTWMRVPDWMKVNLASLWAASHLVLGVCMLSTLFTESVAGATFLISITGFSWAITQWAPFSLLAEAILTEPDPAAGAGSIRLADTRTPIRTHDTQTDGDEHNERDVFLPGDDPDLDEMSDDGRQRPGGEDNADDTIENRNSVMGNSNARTSRIHVGRSGDEEEWEDDDWEGGDEDRGTSSGGLSAKAGIILGIHNVFIVIPQFLVTGISAIIFAVFDPVQTPSGGEVLAPPPAENSTVVREMLHGAGALVRDLVKDAADEAELNERGGQSNSIVYIFRLGGVAALIAFILSWRLAKELRHR